MLIRIEESWIFIVKGLTNFDASWKKLKMERYEFAWLTRCFIDSRYHNIYSYYTKSLSENARDTRFLEHKGRVHRPHLSSLKSIHRSRALTFRCLNPLAASSATHIWATSLRKQRDLRPHCDVPYDNYIEIKVSIATGDVNKIDGCIVVVEKQPYRKKKLLNISFLACIKKWMIVMIRRYLQLFGFLSNSEATKFKFNQMSPEGKFIRINRIFGTLSFFHPLCVPLKTDPHSASLLCVSSRRLFIFTRCYLYKKHLNSIMESFYFYCWM